MKHNPMKDTSKVIVVCYDKRKLMSLNKKLYTIVKWLRSKYTIVSGIQQNPVVTHTFLGTQWNYYSVYRIEYSIIISTSPSSIQFRFSSKFNFWNILSQSKNEMFSIWFVHLVYFEIRIFRSSDKYSMHNKRTIDNLKKFTPNDSLTLDLSQK